MPLPEELRVLPESLKDDLRAMLQRCSDAGLSEEHRRLIAEIPHLVRLLMIAERFGLEEESLRRLWRRKEGSPRLWKIKNGLYLVSITEVRDYLDDNREASAEESDARRILVRNGAGGDEAARRRRVRVGRDGGSS